MTNVRIDKERMEAVTSSRPMTRFKHFMSKLWKHRKGKAGLIILFGLVIFALIGHFAAPYNPLANNAAAFQPPSQAHLLGTDYIGQDILSWFMVGTAVRPIENDWRKESLYPLFQPEYEPTATPSTIDIIVEVPRRKNVHGIWVIIRLDTL